VAYTELEQALLDRLAVNDAEEIEVLAEQLNASNEAVVEAARGLVAEGIRVVQDPDAPGDTDVTVVRARPGAGPQVASPGDGKPPA